jgi:hypothetical protein
MAVCGPRIYQNCNGGIYISTLCRQSCAVQDMKTYGGVEIYLHPFLTSALKVVSRLFQTSGDKNPRFLLINIIRNCIISTLNKYLQDNQK